MTVRIGGGQGFYGDTPAAVDTLLEEGVDYLCLEALADDSVVVAPSTRLPADIVATGWQRTMRCDRYDPSALSDFIRTVGGRYNAHTATASGVGPVSTPNIASRKRVKTLL